MTVPDTFRVLLTYEEPITETSFYGMWRCYIDRISGWHAYSGKLMDCCRDAGLAIDRLADKGTVPRGPQGDTIEPVTDDTILGHDVANITLQKKGSMWEATSDLDPRWIGQAVDARHAMTEAASIIRARQDAVKSTPQEVKPTPRAVPKKPTGRPPSLSSDDRQDALTRRAAGESVGELAEVFGVHRNTISAVTKDTAPVRPTSQDIVIETLTSLLARQEERERQLQQEIEQARHEVSRLEAAESEAMFFTEAVRTTLDLYRDMVGTPSSPNAKAAPLVTSGAAE